MKKRLLAALLALCMALALLPPGMVVADDIEMDSAVVPETTPVEDIEMDTAASPETAPVEDIEMDSAMGPEIAPVEDTETNSEEAGIMPLTTVDDHTPPKVTGVYMNSPGGTVTVGDTLYFTVSAEDENGIYARGSFLTFSVQEYQHIYAYANSYDENTKQVKFQLTIRDDMLNGTYKLSYVSICDTYYNSASYYPDTSSTIDFSTVCFTVVGSSATDRDLLTVESVSMEEPGKVVTVGETLYFTVSTEDESGIADRECSLYFTYVCEQGHEHYVSSESMGYDVNTKQEKVKLTISDDMLNGTYTLSRVEIYGGIYNSYDPDEPGTIDFNAVYFTVTGSSRTIDDHDPPTVDAVSMEEPGKVVTVGDTLHFTVSTEDAYGININFFSAIGTTCLRFAFVCEQGHEHLIKSDFGGGSYDEDAKQAKFKLTITDDMLNGTYTLSLVEIWDTNYNYTLINRTNTYNIDFDAVYFVIASPDIEPEAVSIPESLSLSVRSTKTIYPTVTPVESIPDWTWRSDDTSVAEVTKVESGKACLITGIAPGTTTITGTTQNGLTASCVVTVNDAPLPESGTINETYVVGVDYDVDIFPALTPSDATTLYEVSSDNPHVASIGLINGGTAVRIHGVNPGTATITIRGVNNLVMTTTVTVGKPGDTLHEKTTIKGYPATCIRAGQTDTVVCSACRYVFTESREIPATGEHTYGEWRVVQEANATTAGLKERYCEVCSKRETETIPATGNSPENPSNPGETDAPSTPGSSGNTGGSSGSGSSGGSSGGGGSSNSSSSQSIAAGNQKVPVTVKNETVEMSATKDQIADMIASSTADGIVKIDVSSIKNASEIYIPQDVVNSINDSESVSSLSITMESGSIEMSKDALNTVSNALTGSNDQVAFKIDTISVDSIPATQKYPISNVLNSAVFIELSANLIHKDEQGKTIATEQIREFKGDVNVSVPYEMPADMQGRQIIACHIADDGTITYFPVKYENGVATFVTTHFSTFAVVESRAAAFGDIDISAWYMLSVEYALNSGLMNGYGKSMFAPDNNLSRAMLAQILYNKEGKPDMSGSGDFTDVSASDWYSNAVTWAAEKGVVSGYGSGLFGPNDNISREQLAVMLWRYAGRPAPTDKELQFTDADTASGYALDALCWATENGVLNGLGGKRLDPRGLATRAQVAQMLKNYLEN